MDNLIDEIVFDYEKLFQSKSQFTIGLSGGVDSVVLLYFFDKVRYRIPIQLNAVHVNHGISANAYNWEQFCINLCAKLNIPLTIAKCRINKSGGESLENNARVARYEIFGQLNSEVIILAHHKNDQVETMLSQILRGSDLHNIAAMRSVSEKFGKLFWRPLLSVSRVAIELFATRNQITHIEDESNNDVSYLRNFVRHRLLPEMLVWDSSVINKLMNITHQMQDVATLMDEFAIEDLSTTADNGLIGIILSVEKFKSLSNLRQINLLNYYIRTHNLPIPSRKKIQEFSRQVTKSAWDKYPRLDINNDFYLFKVKNQIKIIKMS